MVLLAVASGVALGQGELSREAAVSRALERNYGLEMVRLQAEQAAVGNDWGAAGALPRIALTASPSSAVSDQRENPATFLQEKIESSGLSYGAQASWTLFDGMGMFANKRALDLLEAQAGGEVELLIEQTTEAVLKAYDAVVVQDALLDVLRKSLRFSEAQIAYLATREEVGASGSFDRLQFESAMLADSVALIQQEVARDMALRNLNRLMGDSEEEAWTLTSALTAPAELPDLAQMEGRLAASETSIRNALLGEALAETALDQAQARLYPVVGLAVNWGDQFSQLNAGDLSAESRVKNSSAALTLNFNLFNGGATRRAIDQARIQADLAQTVTENQRAASLQLFYNAYDQYTAQQEVFRLAEAQVERAEQLVALAADRYTFGAMTSLDVRELQLNQLRAEVGRLQVLQAWNAAWVELQRLTGAFLSPISLR